jgi:N-acyl-D-amino-acid deacylase
MYDILIKGGTIIDGTGEPMFSADVAVAGDRIAKIGNLSNERGEIEIEAEGKIVCPGFIDVNNHSDTYWRIFLNPDLESLVYQGITTIVGGNCGSSLAPLTEAKNIETIQKWVDLKEINVNWLSLEEFFGFLGDAKLSVNFATLVGHGTLRRGLLGDDVRSPNPKELRFFENKLKEAMKQGALGLSTGLVYSHARLASFEELKDLAGIVRKYHGVYTTHIKDEGDELIDSLEEAVRIGREAGVKLHISHLKAVGMKNWPKMAEALAMIDQAQESGVDISFDVYPYTNTGSVLYTLLPAWVAEGGRKMMLRRLKDLVVRDKVIAEMRKSDFEYEKVEISSSPLDKTLTRRKITEIAKSQGQTVEDAIIDILIASEGRVITSMEVLGEENVKKAIIHPLSIIATNGAGYDLEHAAGGEIVHQRSFGTFQKVLAKYVLEEEVIRFEDAVRKMTAAPAEKFQIKKRGRIQAGFFADILIMDRAKISSPSSRENTYQYSRGIEHSMVNGKMVISDGVYQSSKRGRIIKAESRNFLGF